MTAFLDAAVWQREAFDLFRCRRQPAFEPAFCPLTREEGRTPQTGSAAWARQGVDIVGMFDQMHSTRNPPEGVILSNFLERGGK